MIKKILLVLFILVMIPVLLASKLIYDIASGDPDGPRTLHEAARLMIHDIPRKPIEPTAEGYLAFMTPENRDKAAEHFAKLMLHAERREAVPLVLEKEMRDLFHDLDWNMHPAERRNYYMAFLQMCELTHTLHLISPSIMKTIDRYGMKWEKYYHQKQ